MEEAKQKGIPVLNATPNVHCKVFEDNAGAIEIANVPKKTYHHYDIVCKYIYFF